MDINKPIMPQDELIFYVVDITPYAGYEVVFEGKSDECLQWSEENNREVKTLYNLVEIDQDIITTIVSKTMIDAIVSYRNEK